MALFPAYGSGSNSKDFDSQNVLHTKNISEENFGSIKRKLLIETHKDVTEDNASITSYDEVKNNSLKTYLNDSLLSEASSKKKKSKKRSKKQKREAKKNKKKSKKKRYESQSDSRSSSDTDSKSVDGDEEERKFRVPTHNGRVKNILFDGNFRSLKSEETLYFDLLPDKNNSIFCNTHYSQIASYSRLHPIPLGADIHLNRKKKLRGWKNNRYFGASEVQHDPIPVTKLLEQDIFKDYIPLYLTHNEEMKLKTLKNRTVETLGDVNSSEIKKEIISDKDYWQNLNTSYNEKLRVDPHNISLWIDFVDIQDKVLAYSFDGSNIKETGKDKKYKMVIERKISVLDKAIGKNPRSLELHHKKLQLGEKIWEKEKLKSEWNKLVFNFVNDLSMWNQYLIFYQTYFPIFNLDEVVKAYSKCTERLTQMQKGTFLSHKLPKNLTFKIIDITLQLAFTWYQCGFIERSLALFQALFEFNLFCPLRLQGENIDEESKLDLFEAFWDSKAPRFGEKDSVGWAEFMEKKQAVKFNEEILGGTTDEEDKILLEGGSKPKLWIELESSRECRHWLPWQEDPDYCEDVERMVSFPEIKKHLFSIKSHKEMFYFAMQCLNFLGVPIPESLVNTEFPFLEHKDSPFFPLRLESFECLLRTKVISDYGMFNIVPLGPSIYNVDSTNYYDFICGIINRLISLPSPYKSKYVIILIGLYKKRCLMMKQKEKDKFASLLKVCKKNIKQLMKQNDFKNNPEIYFEFARFEVDTGNYDEALKINSATLSLFFQGRDIMTGSTESEMMFKHLLSFVKSHLEKEVILEQSLNEILNAVCSVVLDKSFVLSQCSPKSGQILRAKKKLNSCIDTRLNKLLENTKIELLLLSYSIELYLILQLLTEGYQAASLMLEDTLKTLEKFEISKEKSLCQNLRKLKENVYQSYIWVIDIVTRRKYFVSSSNITILSIKKVLKDALEVAPNNLIFLEKLGDYQNWRDILCGFEFHSQKKKSNDALGTIFRLLPHIKKVVSLLKSADYGIISSGHQLESILESAVSSESGKNCPLLWRIYLRLVDVSNPKKVRDLAYRAIDSCPNAKCLYMDCIRLLPDLMPEVLKMMSEKGIRIRLPLEELEVLLEEENEEMALDPSEKSDAEESLDPSRRDSISENVMENCV